MAIVICPYMALSQSNFNRVCSRLSCPLWHEPLEMCSHKATALLLYDIHQVVIHLGIAQGLLLPQEGEKDEECIPAPEESKD